MTKITTLIASAFVLAACGLGSVSAPPQPSADFPRDPIGAGGISDVASIAAAFASASEDEVLGPCLSEPTSGALYPRNFTPLFLEWFSASDRHNIFELRLHIDNQQNDLVVYTDQTDFTLPDSMWSALVEHSQNRDITVKTRSAQRLDGKIVGAVSVGTSSVVRIAPADAPGTIVYWTTSGGSALKGFRIGDRAVRTVLTPALIASKGKPTDCIGCHAASPDGALAFFGRTPNSFSVGAGVVDGSGSPPLPESVSANALANLGRADQDLPTLSKAHYSATDAVVITTLYHTDTGNKYELVWTDLHAQSGGWGILRRNGDTRGAVHPSWSHDGNTILYMSTNGIASARADKGDADLWTVPYGNRAGGAAGPLPGVNSPTANQYYPVYSPGDSFIAFNRNPRGSLMYDSPTGEIWVAPGAGGEPQRLPANDPPACTGLKSPGLTNSWPRWSPTAWTEGGKRYYWLVFSSKRRYNSMGELPQLYMSAIVTSENGNTIEAMTPAIYITTQPANENNHTPAWDDFVIPAG